MHAHARRFLLLMVMMLAAAALVRCGQPAANRTKAPAAGALDVIAHVPENDTPVRATVDVVFDRPMVALGVADPDTRAGAKLLHIEPAVAGAYHWIGTRTLSFVASGGLPPATHFRARIPAGVRALDGATLPQDIAWEFTTPRPEIVASIPAAGDSLARPGDPIVLLFNTAVEPEAVARAAQLDGVGRWNASRPDSLLLRQLGAGFWGAEVDRMVRLGADPPLVADRDYELVLNDALRVRGGVLGPREPLRIRFRTHGAPGLRSLRGQGDILSLMLHTPVEPESARAYLRLEPAPERLTVWGYQRELYLGGGLAPRTSYAVTLRAGMPDRFGQRLAHNTTASVVTGGRSPQLQLAPQDAVLERGAPRQVAIVHAAVGPVRVRARRLGVTEEIALRARPVHGAQRVEFERVLPAVSDAALHPRTELVDLGTVVAAGDPAAVLVEVQASVPGNAGHNSEWESRSVLRWTDLALAVKMAPENGTAWATQLASGTPLAGVGLSIQDDQGKTLWRGQSDAQGLARLPGYRALERDPWQVHLIGAVDGDTSHVALDGDWRVAPWRFDIPAESDVPPVDARAFLYADRNLYRPAETARIAGLVRRFSSRGLDASRLDSVRVVVTDPRGKAILSQHAMVDADGGFDFQVALAAQPALGRYNASVQVPVPGKKPAETTIIGTLGFEVAAYRAPAFRVDVRGRTRHVEAGEPLVAEVTAAYYFGTPLAGAGLRWSCTRQRGHFRPAGFDDYLFEDPDGEDVQAGPVANDVGVLSDSGTAMVRVVVPPGSFPSTQLLTLEATVQDPSGDTVADWTGFYLHPAPVYAGVGLDRSFIFAGDSVTSRVVVVRADTAVAVSGAPIEVELVRRTWRTASKLQVGGRVGYETTAVDSVLRKSAVESASEPVRIAWAPSQPGMYLVRARARSEDRTSPAAVATFYVAGASRGGWRPDDTPQVTLQTDRAIYAAGDTARVLLASPFHLDRVLVTVEREGVLEARLVRIDRATQTIAVPVLAEYAPNVYVGVAVVEPGLAESDAPNLPASARLPRYAVGYATLRLDVSSRRLAVKVHSDASEYAPGGTATLEVELLDASGTAVAGRVGIAVVDEAVLALLGTPVPDPFAFFYSTRGLGVRNADTRLRLSAGARAEAKAMKGEAGGDGGAAGGEARSNFATTAYWNPNVRVDASGHARVSVTLPDNLTRFRVVAVAASGQEYFGAGQTSFRVARSLVVQPALPRFAVQGDTLEVAAVVTNRAAESRICRVEMTSALEAFDLRRGRAVRHPAAVPRVATVEIAPGASRRVAFGAIAVEHGTIPVRFAVQAGPEGDAVAANLPVMEPLLAWTEATAGATSTSVQEAVQTPPRALPERTTLELDLAASALAGASPAFRNVQEYPFGCLEQNASRLLAFVLQREVFGQEDAALTRDLDAAIADAVRRVEAHATPWGAFSFWPGGGPAPGWAATWATFALARAAKSGALVSEELQSSAPWRLAAQWREARGEESKPPTPFGLGFWTYSEFARPEAGGAFELADVDVAVDASVQWPEDERFWLALALARWELRPDFVRATRDAALDKLENTAAGSLVPAVENDRLPEAFCTSARATSLVLALAATSLASDDARTTRLATGLLGLRREAHWGHTQDDILALFALATYRAHIEKVAGPLAAAIHNGTEELLRLDAASGSLAQASRTVAWPAAGALDISATGGGTAHYAAVLRGFEDGRTAPADESGFTLVRRIERLEGKGPLRLGDLAIVTLEIVVPRESHYLAVRDPLPGGLEVVQTQFRVEARVARDALARWSGAQRIFPATYSEKRDREVWVFADEVPAGVYVHRYVARVRASGGFAQMPATIEAMYTPELVGRTAPSRFRALPPVAEKP